MVWREWRAHRQQASGEIAAVVLLHGGFGSWLHWVRNVEALAEAYRVLAADIPGLGASAMPDEPITPEHIGEILGAGLERIAGDCTRIHVVGFSFGGLLAGQVAAALGGRAATLVLVGASGLGLPRPPLELVRREPDMDAEALAAARRYNLRALMLHRDESIDELALHVHAENDRRARLRSRRMSLGDSLKRVLPSVASPVHGIWGEHDVTAGPYLEQRRRLLDELHPGGRFEVIEDAGHWVQYEASERFNDTLSSLLYSSGD